VTAALLIGVVATSVVGSVHCLAMCGPLVGLHGGAKTMRLAVMHSLGRLTTYVGLGAIAGLVGSAVNVAGQLGDVQRAATIVAAALIIGMGVYQIVGVRRPASGARGRSPFAAALVHIRPKSAVKRSYLIGSLTGLIPCGWLWAFVIAAAATASPLTGAVTMFAFWLGTVPAMVGVLRVTAPLIARLRARMPAVTAIALIAVGVGTLALRWRDAGATQVEAPQCHEQGAS
jgi:hypothetical protein